MGSKSINLGCSRLLSFAPLNVTLVKSARSTRPHIVCRRTNIGHLCVLVPGARRASGYYMARTVLLAVPLVVEDSAITGIWFWDLDTVLQSEKSH
ncbi:hypothetical protein SCLCIDRAFT_1216575 [Scleroderma citrinum Foug A]|uniref:Uncharacterized protein n=1 Tax=Scleroderma citrinum Foug A TaxID=1036808 RepID=A0A0C2ZG79_9AGAM|nr:hypothetical protein SCLCIDRAFT_1216575 [Scleroderma citrinum Foug A]